MRKDIKQKSNDWTQFDSMIISYMNECWTYTIQMDMDTMNIQFTTECTSESIPIVNIGW